MGYVLFVGKRENPDKYMLTRNSVRQDHNPERAGVFLVAYTGLSHNVRATLLTFKLVVTTPSGGFCPKGF